MSSGEFDPRLRDRQVVGEEDGRWFAYPTAAMPVVQHPVAGRADRVDEGRRSGSCASDAAGEPHEQSLFCEALKDAAADPGRGHLARMVCEDEPFDLSCRQEAVFVDRMEDLLVTFGEIAGETGEVSRPDPIAHRLGGRERRRVDLRVLRRPRRLQVVPDRLVHATG